MTKQDIMRKLAVCDAEIEEAKSQMSRLQTRLRELEQERRGYLEQLERGDYEPT
jgi:chromosome segregation ATPase